MSKHLWSADTNCSFDLRRQDDKSRSLLDGSAFSSFDGEVARPASAGQRVCLLHIIIGKSLSPDDTVKEFVELVRAVNVRIEQLYQVHLGRFSSKYCIGSGKANEIRDYLEREDIRLLIVNRDLSPGQERNLERLCHARVLGRSGLILDIFSQRARSHEGKLQVELAQLDYLSTRLIRGWSHLERQKGGIGLRGPGEKQIETDRRLLGKRMTELKKRLDRIKSQRCLSRRMRRKSGLPTIALVGYTNAGKTALFNRLTQSRAHSANRLFATLDPMMRRYRIEFAGGDRTVIISDTVGFIRDLPHTLIEAFNATLLEVREADLLLHVVDMTVPEYLGHQTEVDQVLSAIGAANIPKIVVFNKADLVQCSPTVMYDDSHRPTVAVVSAMSGEGLEALKRALMEFLTPSMQLYEARIPVNAGSLRSFIYDKGQVVREEYLREEGWLLQLRLSERAVGALLKQAGKSGFAFELSKGRAGSD